MQTRNNAVSLMVFFMIACAGCSTTGNSLDSSIQQLGVQEEADRIKRKSEQNYFFVNSNGDIENPETERPFRNRRGEIEWIKELLDTDRSTVMIYIHGGLNSKSDAADRAAQIQALTNKDPDLDLHTIFVNWRSGPVISYWDHLFFHRQGERWLVAGPLTSPFVLLEDIGRALVSIPRSIVNTLNIYRKTYPFNYTPSGRNSYKLEQIAEEKEYFGSFNGKTDKRLAGQRVIDHIGSTGTHTVSLFGNMLMEFLGPGAWNVMKRRTELMFVKSRPPTDDRYEGIAQYRQLREGGLNRFLRQLKQIQKEETEENREYLLVGHSMGAIVANNILTAQSEIEFDRIIYMGAACSIREFQLAAVPYLVNHEETEFYNYMLHPLAENSEAGFYGMAGAGSLLVQIDDIYEDPVAENQRTLGRWENVMNGLNYFDVDDEGKNYSIVGDDEIVAPVETRSDVRSRIHLRTIPFSRAAPAKHGEFDDLSKMGGDRGFFWERDYYNGRH